MSRLVSAKDMLIKARDGKYAVAQININNLERLYFRLFRNSRLLLSSVFPKALVNICAVSRP